MLTFIASTGASTIVGTPQDERGQDLASTASRSPPTKSTDIEKGTVNHADDTPAIEESPKAVPEGYKEYDDPNIVNWDGPDDPNNPYNWKTSKKIILAASIAAITFITYVFPPRNAV